MRERNPLSFQLALNHRALTLQPMYLQGFVSVQPPKTSSPIRPSDDSPVLSFQSLAFDPTSLSVAVHTSRVESRRSRPGPFCSYRHGRDHLYFGPGVKAGKDSNLNAAFVRRCRQLESDDALCFSWNEFPSGEICHSGVTIARPVSQLRRNV